MIVYAISTQSSRLHDGLDRLYRFSAPSDLHTFTPGAVQQFPHFISQKLSASVPFISKQQTLPLRPYCFVYFASRSLFRFSRTNGLFAAMRPNIKHPSICPQSAQVSSPFSRTQLCTGQSLSQKGVFAPSMRQPMQFIISGVIVTTLSFVHRAAVFSRRALSFVSVAIRASHFSQSSPQQPIS